MIEVTLILTAEDLRRGLHAITYKASDLYDAAMKHLISDKVSWLLVRQMPYRIGFMPTDEFLSMVRNRIGEPWRIPVTFEFDNVSDATLFKLAWG